MRELEINAEDPHHLVYYAGLVWNVQKSFARICRGN
jgi:hypothetical protein